MKRFSRIAILLVVLGAFFALVVSPAIATEETEQPTSTTSAEEPAPTSDIEPAVSVTTPPEAETTPDWTYRYLIPTGIALAILIVIVTTVQYFTSVVRKRYRIVEE